MVRIRVLDILKERKLSKYWLYKRTNMSYQNFNKIVTNQTTKISFETLDMLSSILECDIGTLFEKIEDTDTAEK